MTTADNTASDDNGPYRRRVIAIQALRSSAQDGSNAAAEAADVLDKLEKQLQSLVQRALSRNGNITAVELLERLDGERASSSITHLAILTVDMPAAWMEGICSELQQVLPTGSKVTALGDYHIPFDIQR